MDKSYAAVLAAVFVLVFAAIIFYTNPAQSHKQIAIGLCEIQCQHLNVTSTGQNNFCAAKNISYGYSCAVSNSANAGLCNNTNSVYVDTNCQLVYVG